MGLLRKLTKVATGGLFPGISSVSKILMGPKPPDPNQLANTQLRTNTETARLNARLNRLDQTSAFGSRKFTDLGNDRWSVEDTLNPEDQANLDRRRELARQFGASIDPNSFTKLPGINDFGAERDSLTDSVYRRMTRTLDPRFDREGDQLRTRLINQGVTEGSEAWRGAMDEFNDNKNRAYADANDSAISAGAAEQSRLFGLGLGARQQQMGEFGTAMSYLNPNGQQFDGISDVGVAAPDIAGMTQDAYNAKMANRNNLINGAIGVGSLFALSDRRAKTAIEKVGKLDTGLSVYKYRYKGSPMTQIGVMADEVERMDPEAVATGSDGYKRVDYARL